MHAKPRLVRPDALAAQAAETMERFRITTVLVVDAEDRLVGALNTHDLMREKVI
jgi:arabinose-5-phosphate isomerase